MAKNRYYQGPSSDHFDGVRFFNPGQASTDRGPAAFLRWKLAGGAAPWPKRVPVTPVTPEARMAGLRITAVGHATTLIQAAGVNILTDPIWSERASPLSFVGPRRVAAPGVAFEDLPPIDAVLLSHCHYDHLDLPTLRRLVAAHDPLLAMPLGNDAIVRANVPGARCVAGDWWERIDVGGGLATTLTPATHWANRSPFDVRMALWSGHFLTTPVGTVWFAGDTDYGDGAIFHAIRERLGAPDVALIPIGAYEPRWFMAPQHMDPADAVAAHRDLGAALSLGIHWGTFQLTDEAIDAPPAALADARDAAGLDAAAFQAPDFGATLVWRRRPLPTEDAAAASP